MGRMGRIGWRRGGGRKQIGFRSRDQRAGVRWVRRAGIEFEFFG